jgi:hypothetical protein
VENDNGDDYMTQSIAEAEKEVADKHGSIDMQREIQQLEQDSTPKESKLPDDADINQRKNVNKMAD